MRILLSRVFMTFVIEGNSDRLRFAFLLPFAQSADNRSTAFDRLFNFDLKLMSIPARWIVQCTLHEYSFVIRLFVFPTISDEKMDT